MNRASRAMLADYHIHTPFCGHARGKTIEYVESACALGLDEIAFTDHLGRYYLSNSQRKRYWDWGMAPGLVERYVEEIVGLQETYRDRITIRLGLEIDYIEGAEELLEPLIARYPFDFLLGSLHCLPAFSWRHLSRISGIAPIDIYREYFRCAVCAAQSGVFSALAHLDFVWRYITWPENYSNEIVMLIDTAVKAAADCGTCIELNSNAYEWSLLHETTCDPLECLLKSVAQHRVCVTLGSDAHAPEAVGGAFGDTVPLLEHHGISHQARFDQKRKTFTPLTVP